MPVDDRGHYWYAIFTSFGEPVNKDEMRRQRLELYELPDYVPRKNKSNDYGFDAHEQEHATFTGMGADINVHDQWACESMGAIQDRTQEHLGTSDKAISAYRRLLRQALDQSGGGTAPMMVLDAAAAAKICAALIESERGCETTVFDGQRLSMQAEETPQPPTCRTNAAWRPWRASSQTS